MNDLTVVAIPVYFGGMGAEYLWLRDHSDDLAAATAAYERRDTVASLTMGVLSLAAPLILPRVLRGVVPGKGRYGRALVATALSAAALTTVADFVGRLDGTDFAGDPRGGGAAARRGRNDERVYLRIWSKARSSIAGRAPRADRSYGPSRGRAAAAARRLAGAGGAVAIATGVVAVTTAWASSTSMSRAWRHRVVNDLGTGAGATAAAVLLWDFMYYWNHRLMHESRFMWAIHVVHHSSERYNLSTALRQPVAEAFGTFLPYSALALAGFRPRLVNTARGVNLLYQFWIHTETVGRLGAAEKILNTPSHHRVHHGSNGRYLDRNHGSIFIIWDRLFQTFEPESERVVYGLTKNIDTFNPARIAAHEYAEIFRDVVGSRTWEDRLSFVLRGPGWAGRRRAEQLRGSGGSNDFEGSTPTGAVTVAPPVTGADSLSMTGRT